jgi:D-arabinose 1-dehydrogenase-like Zn-dependent alcohol dehydrogenase
MCIAYCKTHQPHEQIAVIGIGALGHLGIQYSKAAGFETIAVTHSKDKEELAYKLGADSVVSDGEALLKYEEGGADVILTTSNSYKATADVIKGIRPDGRVMLMGFSTTESLMLCCMIPIIFNFMMDFLNRYHFVIQYVLTSFLVSCF